MYGICPRRLPSVHQKDAFRVRASLGTLALPLLDHLLSHPNLSKGRLLNSSSDFSGEEEHGVGPAFGLWGHSGEILTFQFISSSSSLSKDSSTSVTINFMCQLNWGSQCLNVYSNIILGASVRVFLEEMRI